MRIFVWSYLFTQYGYGDNQDGSNGLRSYPLDYTYSGRYHWGNGRLDYQSNTAYIWSSAVASNENAYRLSIWPTHVYLADSYNKVFGYNLRCSE